LVEQPANVAFLFLSYFDYVMLTYERYQALRAIHIHVPGEPGNEASILLLKYSKTGLWKGLATRLAVR